MGFITNIYFKEKVSLDNVNIGKGMSTQVRWDLGIGEIFIDANGKIYHTWVSDLGHSSNEDVEEYAKLLKTYTGVIETNMGYLYLRNGQLENLDISASSDEVTLWVNGNTSASDYKNTKYDGHYILSDYEDICSRIKQVRENANCPEEVYNKYLERKNEIIDPFH